MESGRFWAVCAVMLLLVAPVRAETALSDDDLLKMAGNKYASGELPLGDNHYVLDAARKGSVFLCHKFGDERGGGAGRDGPWIHGATWNILQKMSVAGHVNWPQAQFSNNVDVRGRSLTGNGLPVGHATGVFPIQSDDPAYSYDRNPSSISAQSVREVLPLSPVYTDPPYCMGMEVGTMLDGVPLFNGFDAGLRDAAAHEVQDNCQGHPQQRGVYHYHSLSSCISNVNVKSVIGYALDGFPITGPMVAAGKYLTTDDLDVCHGITSEVIEDGVKKVTYHYVMTVDFPYSASCFRAKPVRIGPSGSPPMGQGMMQMPQQAGPSGEAMRGAGQPPRQPPAEALAACDDHADGEECEFVSPRGDTIAGTCHAPPQSGLACIPAGMR